MNANEAATDAMREMLYELLRRTRPRIIVAVLNSGEKRKLDTGGGRQVRYAQLARQVVSWAADIDRLDLCNAAGELIESWHPRGQPVEDDEEPAALERIPVGGSAQEIATFALLVGERMVAAVQKAVDHREDRRRLEQKDLLEGFTRLAAGMGARLEYVEKQQTQSFKLVREALVMEGQAREQALDAIRLANEKGDPNDPDAMAGEFFRKVMERQLGGGAPAAQQQQHASSKGPKDHDEN